MKKNAFTLVELIAVIVLLCIIVLISFPALTNVIKGGEEKNKEEALNTIYMAAENYLMANYEDYIIDNVGDITYIYINDLINNNYLNADIVNPNNDSSFSSKDVVKITRNEDGTFKYELDYIKTLIEILLEQYNEDNTTGLVKDSINENLYYYTGTNEEVSNNFLWYGGHQWRVLEFDTSAKTLTLITQQPLTAIQSASSVWTTQSKYESSYINTWLNDYFYNSLDDSIKTNIQDNIFNVGSYDNVTEITTTQKVGLLDYEQYKKGGDFIEVGGCYWWLGNRYSTEAILTSCEPINISNAMGIRPVIKISDIIVNSGDGTLVNSYKLTSKSTNTNNVQVGEYINVPYSGDDNACGSDNVCTFRVVTKNENGIKLTLNGLLSNPSIYGSSSTISNNHEIYNPLNTFIENIDSKYVASGTYGVGKYESGNSYLIPQNTTITASVGLPTVGEMFTGNDIGLGDLYVDSFIDISTIENHSTIIDYWTMNSYNSSNVRVVTMNGDLNRTSPSREVGVRPVIYLKNNLNFTGGNGTAQNPYTLN